jgi:DNA-binding PadR family transcriptional regulator
MEVCLLVLLYDEKSEKECHGYSLAEKLKDFGFTDEELNISTLYRTLRQMEQNGWVLSHWESGGQGPQRRVYSITAQGRDALDEWAKVLQRRRDRIGRLLDAYSQLEKDNN